MNANYHVLSVVNEVMKTALQRLEDNIKSCGIIDDSKYSPSTKEYFKKQGEEYKKAVKKLVAIHREINKLMWEDVTSDEEK